MNRSIAQFHYRKLFTDIMALYRDAQESVVAFYWGTGQRLVEVEQDGRHHFTYTH